MKIQFCSEDEDMVASWENVFRNSSSIEVLKEDIFAQPATAIASPRNSFGHMDAGLDLAMCEYFGKDLEQKVQDKMIAEHNGELLVGQVLFIEIQNTQHPYFISAPTMQTPIRITNTINVYHAVR
jgi:O-acetyl-ADP-ribose deacetylase (regulator of RNase III)